MGIASLASRKRKVLGIAALAIMLVLFISVSGSKSSAANSSALTATASKLTANLSADKASAVVLTDSSTTTNAPVDTKKLTNGNNMVKGKSGNIDESKVKQAEQSNPSNNIPLVAGDPTAKEAHDKQPPPPDQQAKESNKNLSKTPVSGKSGSGIKADKNLGSGSGSTDKSSSSSKKAPKDHGNLDKKVIDAQKKAEKGTTSVDTGSSFNPSKEFKNILSLSPVVIFSKSYCPYSKKLKQLLTTTYNITPEPRIVELDNHENGKELQEYIGKHSGRNTVPNLYVGEKSRGGSDDIVQLHNNDELIDLFNSWAGTAAKIEKMEVPSNA